MIVAICGLPGSGKSTLSRAVASHLGAEIVAWDDYEAMTQRPPGEVHGWLRRGAPFDEISAPGLVDRLDEAAGPVVFDTLLGRAWSPAAEIITYAFWLECAPDVALARKVAQFLPDAGPAWMLRYLTTYIELVAPTLAIQRARVPGLCDFTLDALEPTDRLLTGLLNHLQSIK